MMQDCCRQGFRWEGKPTGQETKIEGLDVYVAGDKKDAGILLAHDAFGWAFNNNRLLADHFAQEVGATVYLPDFFHGTAVNEASLPEDPTSFDWSSWLKTNNWDVRRPEFVAMAKHIRSQHTKVGVVGYCWGGKVAIELGGKNHNGLVDCISFAHPGGITKEDVFNVAVPVQIIAPEKDVPFPLKMRQFCNEEIPKLGVDYDYQHFPGAVHGFATRCNVKVEGEKRALERAKNAAVGWFVNYLK